MRGSHGVWRVIGRSGADVPCASNAFRSGEGSSAGGRGPGYSRVKIVRGAAANSMRAAVITGPGQIRIQEVERPQPRYGEVRVRLEGCGVCASNLTPWAGPEWMKFPTEPGSLGHEGWGIIDAVGVGVEGLRAGQPVAALSYHAYAEYDVADAAAVVPLPDALAGQPFPGEPLGCAMNIFRRSEIAP